MYCIWKKPSTQRNAIPCLSQKWLITSGIRINELKKNLDSIRRRDAMRRGIRIGIERIRSWDRWTSRGKNTTYSVYYGKWKIDLFSGQCPRKRITSIRYHKCDVFSQIHTAFQWVDTKIALCFASHVRLFALDYLATCRYTIRQRN